MALHWPTWVSAIVILRLRTEITWFLTHYLITSVIISKLLAILRRFPTDKMYNVCIYIYTYEDEAFLLTDVKRMTSSLFRGRETLFKFFCRFYRRVV